MLPRTTSIVIAGVGGQGNVLMANIIGKAAISAGLDVRGINTYGAAQRGGPVLSQIRIGGKVTSPLVGLREADALAALEPAEAYRAINLLRIGGTAIVNTERILPVEVISGYTQYPPLIEVLASVKKAAKTYIEFNATKVAESAGSSITLNVVMLGALTATQALPVSRERIGNALVEEVPKDVVDMNLRAFELGFRTANSSLDKKG